MKRVSRRTRLFNYLRFCLVFNAVFFVCLVFFFFRVKSSKSRLIEIVEKQFAHNLYLSAELSRAQGFITNVYYSASVDFASNVIYNASSLVSSPAATPAAGSSSPTPDELPDLSFSNYFEVDSVPYIRLRNFSYRKGDFVLGYPIEDISPDVVKYRGRFYKVLP